MALAGASGQWADATLTQFRRRPRWPTQQRQELSGTSRGRCRALLAHSRASIRFGRSKWLSGLPPALRASDDDLRHRAADFGGRGLERRGQPYYAENLLAYTLLHGALIRPAGFRVPSSFWRNIRAGSGERGIRVATRITAARGRGTSPADFHLGSRFGLGLPREPASPNIVRETPVPCPELAGDTLAGPDQTSAAPVPPQ